MSRDGRVTLGQIFKVVRDPRLSPQEKTLWMLYRSYEHRDGRGAYPGDELLASLMDRGERSVQTYRAGLLKKGFLKKKDRGPHGAYYWAIVPPELADLDGAPSDESAAADCDTSNVSQQASQNVSQEVPQHTAAEYGEHGEDNGRAPPSGRSPTGEAGGKSTSRGGRRAADLRTREQMLASGPQAVAAWIAPVLREELYPPDGEPPTEYTVGRDVNIVIGLLQEGYRPERVELAVRGLAHARDAGELEVAGPGEKLTCRVFKSDVTGSRDAVGHFEEIGRRVHAAREREKYDAKGEEGGLERLSAILGGLGGDPRRGNGREGRESSW